MIYFIAKAAISGLLVAIVSEIARRNPGFGALVASLPLVSLLGMIWLWRDTGDRALLADHSTATFWYVVPSLPMFLLIPALLKRGVPFSAAILAGVVLTIGLYVLMTILAPRFGLRL